MRAAHFLISLFAIAILISSCHKNHDAASDCFPDAVTVRQIKDKQAIIRSAGDRFYIIEQGSVDTKLRPCNLAEEFQVDSSIVIISGDVKATLNTAFGPCCTEDFVITRIAKLKD